MRFTDRENIIRIFGARYWKKGKKIKYTDEPLGKLEIIEDFLPSPNDLLLKEDEVMVTLWKRLTCLT